jgi:acetyl-CoA acetyltransferase
MDDVVIVAAARTAVGKFGGALAKIQAADLGAHVIRPCWRRRGSSPSRSPRSSWATCVPPAPVRIPRARRRFAPESLTWCRQ